MFEKDRKLEHMASTGIYDQSYQLDSNQQDLLLAALASNQPNKSINRSDLESNQDPSNPMAADPYQTSPQSRRTPGSSGMEGSLESPFIDYEADYDFDGSYDFPEGEMIGSMPGTSGEHELHDKRKSFDGEEDDDEGGGKRQETDEKSSKKPGRKPLVTEPTTKRKAQNRAAQRAFRERKEKHLKDLETKVADLEKASESANHENSMLRSQVDQLQTELQEYRKRVALGGISRTPPSAAQARDSWTSGNDFQFDFPVFGAYPFPPARSKSNPADKSGASNELPASSNGQVMRTNSYGSSTPGYRQPLMNTPVSSTGVEAFSELFSPSILAASVSMSPASDYNSHKGSVDSTYNSNRTDSLENSHSNNSVPTLNGGSSISNSASPSASSVSQHGPGSSCGTSPEPTVHSPVNSKGIDSNLKTISEENTTAAPSSFMIKTPSAELNGIDWLAQQNGNQFNPDLFGDYRESQDAVGTADFGGFFNEAFPLPDFGSPLQTFDTTSSATQKANILEVMDKKKDEDIPVMPREKATPDMLSMNKIWDHIQNDKKYQSGECDIDGLCKEMTKKAKCTESGLLVKKEDVDKIMARQKPDSK